MKHTTLTRRDFLKSSAATFFAGSLFLYSPDGIFTQLNPKTRVVLIRDRDLLDEFNRPRTEVVQEMLDGAVTTLLDEADPVQAWKRLVKPDDMVGIKSNVWLYLPTPGALEQAIKRRIVEADIPENYSRMV